MCGTVIREVGEGQAGKITDHAFMDFDGDRLCDYVTAFDALEKRCLGNACAHSAESPEDKR